MYAYVVPKDATGKLNCRHFLGGAKALSEMQTDFAENVGRNHGLERGLERSRARHTPIREYYGRVRAATPQAPSVDVPEGKLLEGKEAYGQRVAKSVLAQIAPEFSAIKAKAQQFDLVQQKVKSAELAAKQAETQRRAQERLLQGERKKAQEATEKLKRLANLIMVGGEALLDVQAALRDRDQQQKLETKREIER
jgi:uncharacterized protein YoaH (UPF0181 family)